jgi:LPS export ABC transporter protein LptC
LRLTTRAELKSLHQKLKTTTVYVTHDQAEAMSLGDRICVVHNGKIQQTATRKGKKEWSLEAGSANYIGKTSQMVLKDLMVRFFIDDETEITLAADKGILNTDSNDIEVSGNVVVINKQYKLLTEKLNYANDKRVLYSTAPVTISGPAVHLTADTISFDLNTQKVTLEGSVETKLDNNFTF